MTQPARQIQLGVIGAGAHCSENLLPPVAASADYQLSTICTRSKITAAAAAARWGAARSTDSIAELFEQSEAVLVAGPPELHEAAIREATTRGVPLFVEKPPARSAQLLRSASQIEMSEAAVFVDFNMRFSTAYQTAVAPFASESPQAMKIRMVSRKPIETIWGCAGVVHSFMLAVGIHAVDMVTSRFGPPMTIHAQLLEFDASRFSLVVALDFEGEHLALLDLGNYSNTFESRIELAARDKSVQVDNLTEICIRDPRQSAIDAKASQVVTIGGMTGGYDRNGYAAALSSFASAVRGEGGYASGLEASAVALDVISAILESISERTVHD